MKEKRWLGTQKYEIHCFYCGGFHITGNCPQIVKAMNGWKYDRSCPETGPVSKIARTLSERNPEVNSKGENHA